MAKEKNQKTVYQKMREDAGLTRAEASEGIGFISESRLEKIEYGMSEPHPEEILAMARIYGHPELNNYYCSKVCSIGQKYVPEIAPKELSQIVLELLASINGLYKEKERLIEISVDGVIDEDEMDDFTRIKRQLSELSQASSTLQLWLEKTMGE